MKLPDVECQQTYPFRFHGKPAECRCFSRQQEMSRQFAQNFDNYVVRIFILVFTDVELGVGEEVRVIARAAV